VVQRHARANRQQIAAMTTIADIQAKILAKMENKFKGGATSQRLKRMLFDVDSDKDGLCVCPGPLACIIVALCEQPRTAASC